MNGHVEVVQDSSAIIEKVMSNRQRLLSARKIRVLIIRIINSSLEMSKSLLQCWNVRNSRKTQVIEPAQSLLRRPIGLLGLIFLGDFFENAWVCGPCASLEEPTQVGSEGSRTGGRTAWSAEITIFDSLPLCAFDSPSIWFTSTSAWDDMLLLILSVVMADLKALSIGMWCTLEFVELRVDSFEVTTTLVVVENKWRCDGTTFVRFPIKMSRLSRYILYSTHELRVALVKPHYQRGEMAILGGYMTKNAIFNLSQFLAI